MKIRIATEADIDEIMVLFRTTIQTINAADYTPREIEVWSGAGNDRSRWVNRLSEQHCLVAIVDNQIAGYGTMAPDGYLDFMYVHKDFQRRGVAKALLEKLEEKARSQANTEAYSHVSKTAKPFFEKHGWHVSSHRTVEREDVTFVQNVMRKALG